MIHDQLCIKIEVMAAAVVNIVLVMIGQQGMVIVIIIVVRVDIIMIMIIPQDTIVLPHQKGTIYILHFVVFLSQHLSLNSLVRK